MSKAPDGKVEHAEARRVAALLKTILAPGCERIEIAGSLRRQRPTVGDIELLAVGLRIVTADLWGSPVVVVENKAADIIHDLANGGNRDWKWDLLTPRHGPLYFRIRYGPVPIAVDIFFCRQETYAANLLVRTGPAEYSHAVVAHAKRAGTRSFQHGFELHNHEDACRGAGSSNCKGITPLASEEAVCEALSLPFLPPEKRDNRSLWGIR
jgi:DNA polymerase/3'-5' exonuclease PolX